MVIISDLLLVLVVVFIVGFKCDDSASVANVSGFGITLGNISAGEGNCQELHCGILKNVGKPPVTFEWKRDGNIVHGSLDPSGLYSVLRLCAGMNTGNFTCQLRGSALDSLPKNDSLKTLYYYFMHSEHEEGNDNTGAVIGGVLGAVAVVAVVAGVAVYCWRKKSRNVPEGTEAEMENL